MSFSLQFFTELNNLPQNSSEVALSAFLIISEDILTSTPADGEGMKAGCNHVQLVPLHNLIKRFYSTNYLFVAIICFAELVNPLAHLHGVRDISQYSLYEPTRSVFLFRGAASVDHVCLWHWHFFLSPIEPTE